MSWGDSVDWLMNENALNVIQTVASLAAVGLAVVALKQSAAVQKDITRARDREYARERIDGMRRLFVLLIDIRNAAGSMNQVTSELYLREAKTLVAGYGLREGLPTLWQLSEFDLAQHGWPTAVRELTVAAEPELAALFEADIERAHG